MPRVPSGPRASHPPRPAWCARRRPGGASCRARRRRRPSQSRRCAPSSTRCAPGGDEARAGAHAALRRGGHRRPSGCRPTDLEPPWPGSTPALRAALELAYEPHPGLPPPRARAAGGLRERRGAWSATSCGRWRRAGLYAPGGRARYPSTVLMCAAPARVAGRRRARAVRAARARRRGSPTETLAAAAIAGIDEVYRVGGAQAVAAMAFGTESIAAGRRHRRARATATWPRPSARWPGIVGRARRPSPGRRRWWWWPTTTTPVAWAAIDVVVQAEHGPDGLAWLVTWSPRLADAVEAEVDRSWWRPRPGAPTSRPRLASGGYAVLVDGPDRGAGGGQRGGARAPRAPGGRRRGAPAAGAPRRRRLPRAPTPRPAWVTTWPAPTTCCPRPARPASPRRCASTTSAPTSTPCRLDAPRPGPAGPARGRHRRGRGPAGPRRSRSGCRVRRAGEAVR